jgi:integrase
MSGAIKDSTAKLKNPTSRAKIKFGREEKANWGWAWATITSETHLGYEKRKGRFARWVVRRNLGKVTSKGGKEVYRYTLIELGLADDKGVVGGLSFDDAMEAARALAVEDKGSKALTVAQAFQNYVEHKQQEGQPVGDLRSFGRVHILPPLGHLLVSDLTAAKINAWKGNLATSPAQSRPKKDGKPKFRAHDPNDPEQVRRRRASTNRTLNILKACLNFAFDAGHVASNQAWGRRVKPYKAVATTRVRYLTIEECRRLINAAPPEFRLLIQAALQTGARYGELIRLEVADFHPDSGTLAIRRSKSGKPRHVVLTEEGIAFFKQLSAGRTGAELLLRKPNGGGAWRRTDQARPIREACERAKIKPQITFHGLRHTWASLSVMNGMPLMVVARNLGHADTKMVERVYGHLAPSFITDAIRSSAPRFGFEPDRKVATLSPKRR